MKVKLEKLIGPEETVSGLTLGREYGVIGIEADWYRIINDEGDPCLYEPDCFSVIDPTEPTFWDCKFGEEGERYCYPTSWNRVGFFEDYHDSVQSVVRQFWREHEALYGAKP
ncbi:MAG: hypothetical protein IH984_08935 [Planctomycetes bacterium]|nr:hypothetical protein [Planctomycetota bacterium]